MPQSGQHTDHRPVTWLAIDLRAGEGIPLHDHAHGQLIYSAQGIIQVEGQRNAWIVPPERAVWVPPELPHRIGNRAAAQLRTLYVSADSARRLPNDCQVLWVTPFLRELILSLVSRAPIYEPGSATDRLAQVALDEVAIAGAVPYRLPLPDDPRLRSLVDALLENPGDARSVVHWARACGMSVRTLARVFKQEMGMGFAAWRQQARLMTAIAQLSEGARVTDVALDLGYENPSAFIAMFKRTLGETPGRFVKKPRG
ncbi:MAG: AraC family transcriptional regulator [Parvibaculum sp.]|nr:AraC family transcriptional regulator [Parvibaculum sp.]|tara:strand:+ start:1534 stop:2301 length:768 start_codon:yes stop_codon:yes gene_type:complete